METLSVKAKNSKRLGNQQPSSCLQAIAKGDGSTTIPSGSRVQEDSKRGTKRIDRYAEYKRKWYLENVTKEDRARMKDNLRFGGNKAAVLKRDGNCCQDCGTVGRSERKHHGNGMCKRCWQRKSRAPR